MTTKLFDLACEDIDRNTALAKIHLDRIAINLRAIDRSIKDLEKRKDDLEKHKQDVLKTMMEYMELGVVLTHTLPDGYTVTYDHKRKLEIKSVPEFLKWLKTNCQTSEVTSFFDGAIKAANLKKFVEKKCDEQRAQGILDPKVDGVDIGEITFRRLTTFFKGE